MNVSISVRHNDAYVSWFKVISDMKREAKGHWPAGQNLTDNTTIWQCVGKLSTWRIIQSSSRLKFICFCSDSLLRSIFWRSSFSPFTRHPFQNLSSLLWSQPLHPSSLSRHLKWHFTAVTSDLVRTDVSNLMLHCCRFTSHGWHQP